MCASRSLSVKAALPLTDEEWDKHRLQEFTDIDKVESLSKFICSFQLHAEAEAGLKVDYILPYLNHRMPELLTHYEREILSNPSTPNRDKLRKLFMEYLPRKGRDHQAILQTLYLSLRDSSEDQHLQNHYLLAKQMAEQVQGKAKLRRRQNIQRDPEELLRRLPPKSLDLKTATQLLQNLDMKDEEVIERGLEVKEICYHWLSQQKDHNGAAEKLVQALLCTEGLGCMISYLCVTGWSNPPSAVAVISQNVGCWQNWNEIAQFWGFNEIEIKQMDEELNSCGCPMKILLRALRIPDFGNDTVKITVAALESIAQRAVFRVAIPQTGLQVPRCIPPNATVHIQINNFFGLPSDASPPAQQPVSHISKTTADDNQPQISQATSTTGYRRMIPLSKEKTIRYDADHFGREVSSQQDHQPQICTSGYRGVTPLSKEKTIQSDVGHLEKEVPSRRNNANDSFRITQTTRQLLDSEVSNKFEELLTEDLEPLKSEKKLKTQKSFLTLMKGLVYTEIRTIEKSNDYIFDMGVLLRVGQQQNERMQGLEQNLQEQGRQFQELQQQHQEQGRQFQELQQQHQEQGRQFQELQQQHQEQGRQFQELQQQHQEQGRQFQEQLQELQQQHQELHKELKAVKNFRMKNVSSEAVPDVGMPTTSPLDQGGHQVTDETQSSPVWARRMMNVDHKAPGFPKQQPNKFLQSRLQSRIVPGHEHLKAEHRPKSDDAIASHSRNGMHRNGGRKYRLHVHYPKLANSDGPGDVITVFGISCSLEAQKRLEQHLMKEYHHLNFLCPRRYPIKFWEQDDAVVISIEHIPNGVQVLPIGPMRIYQFDVDDREVSMEPAPYISFSVELSKPMRMVQLDFAVTGIVGHLSVVLNFAIPQFK